MLNTKHPLARLALTLIFILFTPAGALVLSGAFESTEPHIFVMLVFSGSLSLLVGLVGLIGLVASFTSKGASCDQPSDDDEHTGP